jgi:tRNA (guanine37-N1)-methyltransferase
MRIKVFTLFPDMLRPMLSQSILGRAIAAGLLQVELIDIRDYSAEKHRNTDDYPFGGGAGMVMAAQPIVDAFAANLPEDFHGRRIYLSPRGRTLNQRVVEELAGEAELALLCGHYEGVDQRALDAVIDEELSIGDYVLTGGELGALVVIDAVARLVPGVLGSDESSEDESFTTGLLEYPQYTRPADFRGQKVPGALLGGNHADITAWRREQSLALTLQRRPELLDAAPLDDHDRAMLSRLMRAGEVEALLDERDVAFERLPLMLADRWPRAWFAAFVPEASRKAAKKQCFSGRRHRGFLWQAFSMGFIPDFVEGDAAWERWQGRGIQCCLLCLPENGLLYRLPEGIAPEALARFGCAILADEALAHTWMQTGSPARGPYYCDTNRLHP